MCYLDCVYCRVKLEEEKGNLFLLLTVDFPPTWHMCLKFSPLLSQVKNVEERRNSVKSTILYSEYVLVKNM